MKRLVEAELDKTPLPPAAIGGPIVWIYELDDAVSKLRRVDLEALLGRPHEEPWEKTADAASEVFAAVQDYLLPFFATGQPVSLRLYAWRLQVLAKQALFDCTGSPSSVRRVQEGAVGGPALTICIGSTYRSGDATVLGVRSRAARQLEQRAKKLSAEGGSTRIATRRPHGDGCGRAHGESRTLTALYSRYCDRCDPGNLQRAFERKVVATEAARTGGYVLGLCACGNEIRLTRPNVRCCRKCQAAHRKKT